MPSPVDLRAIKKLPATENRWEVALVDVPVTVKGVELEGVLLVVEEDTGDVRTAGPIATGSALLPVLGQAMLDPASSARKARPRALLCADGALCERIRAELHGAKIEVLHVPQLPAADAAAEALFQHMAPHRAPGLTTELPLWASVLTLLCQSAPWRTLPDSVRFSFGGEVSELAGAVALVLGQSGEQEGFVLYRSPADLERFASVAFSGRPVVPDDVHVLQLFVDPEEDFDPEERKAVRAASLSLPGGRMPRALALRDGEAAALTEREQRVLLAAIEAVLRVSVLDTRALLSTPREVVARTNIGPVTVRSAPPAPMPVTLADGIDYTSWLQFVVHPRDDRPAETALGVVLKARKVDVDNLWKRISQADAVSIEPVEASLVGIRLWEKERDLGLLCLVRVAPELAVPLSLARTLLLGLAGGGSERELRESDMAHQMRLRVRGRSDRPRHDPIFDEPAARWPKMSDMLNQLLRGVFGPESARWSRDRLQSELRLAGLAWSAVVYEDFLGSTEQIDRLRASVAESRELSRVIEALILEKRQQFPGDPRIAGEINVVDRNGEPSVIAKWAVVPGYTVGGGPRG